MKITGLTRLLKGTEIKLLEKRVEAGNLHLFVFERPPELHWKPGQHGIFTFSGSRVKGRVFRIFSVASTPDENMIAILTKIGDNPSAFKSRLKSLEKGDVISLRGPFGGFYLSDYSRPVFMVCGGTGVTPMRALLIDLAKHNMHKPEVEAFQSDLVQLGTHHPNIGINLLEGRNGLESNLAEFVHRHANEAQYFISGNPTMVRDLRRSLRGRGIKRRNIRSDSFRGY